MAQWVKNRAAMSGKTGAICRPLAPLYFYDGLGVTGKPFEKGSAEPFEKGSAALGLNLNRT